jgi:hypothetical protein
MFQKKQKDMNLGKRSEEKRKILYSTNHLLFHLEWQKSCAKRLWYAKTTTDENTD